MSSRKKSTYGQMLSRCLKIHPEINYVTFRIKHSVLVIIKDFNSSDAFQHSDKNRENTFYNYNSSNAF